MVQPQPTNFFNSFIKQTAHQISMQNQIIEEPISPVLTEESRIVAKYEELSSDSESSKPTEFESLIAEFFIVAKSALGTDNDKFMEIYEYMIDYRDRIRKILKEHPELQVDFNRYIPTHKNRGTPQSMLVLYEKALGFVKKIKLDGQYDSIYNIMKAYMFNNKSTLIVAMETSSVLEDEHPELMKEFMQFLPIKRPL